MACLLFVGCASHAITPTVPETVQGASRDAAVTGARAVTPLASADVVAIDAGGPAAGIFSADEYYAPGSYTSDHQNTIVTTTIASPAPQAVYQTQRVGTSIAYTIPNLTSNGAYVVRLSFAETFFGAAGKRVFNIAIGGQTVLSNFDIFAAAGGENKAIVESFPATASATGTIAISLTAVTNNASIAAIEIAPATGTPPPTSAPTPTPTGPSTAVLDIDSGGPAAGSFVADTDVATGGTRASSTTAAIDTSAVANPAPQAVYQTMRLGKSIVYTIPGLRAGATYGVRLDFAEIYWSSGGQRVFDVSLNGSQVLRNFDIFAAAGAKDKAIAESFTTVATSVGTIAIAFAAVTDNASINGIEITSGAAGPTPTPAPTSQAIGFNDYTTFGYDNQRDVYNPNSTAITPASLPQVHLAWQSAIGGGDFNSQTQPILATEIPNHAGVLFVGGGSGNVYGYDALTGALLWKRSTGQELFTCEGGNAIYFGVQSSVAYDPGSKSLYALGNTNPAPNQPATNTLYHLDGASGSVLGQTNVAPPVAGWPSLDFSHTSVTLANGYAYVGTGATCDISSWKGRVAAIRVPAMTLANTFFPAWNPAAQQPWGGAGVWGWGGVSVDFSGNVLTGVGNTDNGSTTHGSIVAPFAPSPSEYSAYGDAMVQLSPDLSSVEASNHPIPTSVFHGAAVDLDLNGTPVIFKPSGALCDAMAAIQGKSGSLYIYDTSHVGNGPVASYQLAPSTYADGFLGEPAYSPVTGLLYAAVPSSNESLFAPGMIAINPGCGSPSVAWNSAFGPDSYAPGSLTSPGEPRSAPAVSAGGIVLVGTICKSSGSTCGATTSAKPLICCAPPGTNGGALWALDAATGAVLNGGNPIIFTSGALRMPPTIDGKWIFVIDNSGNLYALTIDPSYPAIETKARASSPRQSSGWGAMR